MIRALIPSSSGRLSQETQWSVLKSDKYMSKLLSLLKHLSRRNKRQLDVVNKEKIRATQLLQRRFKKTR